MIYIYIYNDMILRYNTVMCHSSSMLITVIIIMTIVMIIILIIIIIVITTVIAIYQCWSEKKSSDDDIAAGGGTAGCDERPRDSGNRGKKHQGQKQRRTGRTGRRLENIFESGKQTWILFFLGQTSDSRYILIVLDLVYLRGDAAR